MKIAGGILFGLAIVWSLLQLIAASGMLSPADADLSWPRGNPVAPTSMDVVRRAYADCGMMRDLVARYDAGEHVAAMAMLEASIRCEGSSFGP